MNASVGRDTMEQFFRYLAESDELEAQRLAEGLLSQGVARERILLGLVVPALRRVGTQWASGAWSVAQEHAASYVCDRVAAMVARTALAVAPTRGEVALACVDGEWHALAARCCAEVLRLHGYAVRFLGASVPTNDLVSYLRRIDPFALAVSCTMSARLPRAHEVIRAAHEAGVRVIAGGAGFGPAARWGHRLGADRVGMSAVDALDALHVLAAVRPEATAPAPMRHLADDEHVVALGRRSEIIAAFRDEVQPAQHEPVGVPGDSIMDGIDSIPEFLAAALYVDDDGLLAGYALWLAGLVEARLVSRSLVVTALDVCGRVLYDSPRSVGMLTTVSRQLS